MSDLTPCNRCTLRRMQRTAADRGLTVVVALVEEGDAAGWTSVRYSDQLKPSVWLLELTEECAC